MTLLMKPELNRAIRDFVANPVNEFPKTEALNKLTQQLEVRPYGLTGKQQAMLIMTLLIEVGFAPDNMTQQDFTNALEIVMNLGNASAARQSLEKAGLMHEAPGDGKKRGATAAELVGKYAGQFVFAAPAPAPEAK